MATIPSDATPAVPREPVAERFRRLAAVWEEEAGHISSMAAASEHRAYQEIINLGPAVVPLLLRDLEENQTHWFIALGRITGANPVPPSSAGKIPEMVNAWLRWAGDNGYRW